MPEAALDPATTEARALTEAMGFVPEAVVAQVAGVRLETVRRWRTRECGPPWVRVGKRVLYRREDLVRWLEAQIRRARDAAPATAEA